MRGINLFLTAAMLAAMIFRCPAGAQIIQPPFDSSYSFIDLGSIPGVNANYGGLTFLLGDPNTILIGGAANTSGGQIFSVGVVRDSNNHITAFSGSATVFSDGAYNDGGLAFGPGGVLFYTRYPTNEMGEIKSGSVTTDKIVSLTTAGLSGSVGALNFVPPGFPGAGQLKIAIYNGANWYTVDLVADGSGTFDVANPVLNTTIVGGPEGFIYVPLGSLQFTGPNILVAEYLNGRISAYAVDGSGNPTGAPVPFITNLSGVEGAVIDPLSGDFLFATFGGGSRVIAVRGFAVPGTPTATPTDTPTSTPTDTPTPTNTPQTAATDTPTPTATDTPPVPTPGLDHFICYKAGPAKAPKHQPPFPKFTPRAGVTVTDAFAGPAPDQHELDIKRTKGLCNPANKNGEDPSAPGHSQHMVAYAVKISKLPTPQPKPTPQVRTTQDQFGTLKLKLKGIDRFMVPSAKVIGSGGTAPLANPTLDHFKCYKASVAKAPKRQPPFPVFTRLTVTLTDEFGGPAQYDVIKPKLFCAPADKNGEDPGAPGHPNILVCYLAKLTKLPTPQPPFVKTLVSTNNQFGPEVLNATKVQSLCVPAVRLD